MQAAYDTEAADWACSDGAPLPGADAELVGYRVVRYADTDAAVEVVLSSTALRVDAQLVAIRVSLQWSDDDWQLHRSAARGLGRRHDRRDRRRRRRHRRTTGSPDVPCDPLVPVTCVDVPDPIGEAGDAVAGVIGNQFAEAMADGAGWVLRTTVGWWIDVPAVDLATSPAAHDPRLRPLARRRHRHGRCDVAGHPTRPVAQSRPADRGRPRPVRVRALRRRRHRRPRGRPARRGLASPRGCWTSRPAAPSPTGSQIVAAFTGVTSSGAVIVLGLLMILSGLAQAVVMIFREGAVVVLSGVVVLAAAGVVRPGHPAVAAPGRRAGWPR